MYIAPPYILVSPCSKGALRKDFPKFEILRGAHAGTIVGSRNTNILFV